MQSACLLSDMEAFKAANPGCVLADFVRWYSPRDWIEDTVVNDDGTTQHTGCHLLLLTAFLSSYWAHSIGPLRSPLSRVVVVVVVVVVVDIDSYSYSASGVRQ